jgi:predicted SAM-dependent methyltransferase
VTSSDELNPSSQINFGVDLYMRKLIVAFVRLFGYDIQKLPKRVEKQSIRDENRQKKFKGKRVYVGCGDDHKDGYIGCDLRDTLTTSIQCKAWELSDHCENLEEIYSRHMVEHLTIKEVECCLVDWRKSLKSGGRAVIIIPNMDFHIMQWGKARWNKESLSNENSNAAWGMAGFWGWQRECDPTLQNYDQSHWDVHKSGFNEESITYFLNAAGFRQIETKIVDECHLHAIAVK